MLLVSSWAARYNTWLLIKLTPKGVVFYFIVFSFLAGELLGRERYNSGRQGRSDGPSCCCLFTHPAELHVCQLQKGSKDDTLTPSEGAYGHNKAGFVVKLRS
jgi:hypothetical protein